MKIGIGNADVPRNEAMRANLYLFLRHDQRTIEQREISDRALAINSDGK